MSCPWGNNHAFHQERLISSAYSRIRYLDKSISRQQTRSLLQNKKFQKVNKDKYQTNFNTKLLTQSLSRNSTKLFQKRNQRLNEKIPRVIYDIEQIKRKQIQQNEQKARLMKMRRGGQKNRIDLRVRMRQKIEEDRKVQKMIRQINSSFIIKKKQELVEQIKIKQELLNKK